ncbi:hypothetical protein E3N88_22385 [Mikania micrantha]|uniref:Uncharacterized protein n=1 Tax=Mikania micrantha TaxID=192012 RepID=A0A5N6NAK4_9ASTR|nr:hypothetical protein E3N88_22385 [Mikania micrantha]
MGKFIDVKHVMTMVLNPYILELKGMAGTPVLASNLVTRNMDVNSTAVPLTFGTDMTGICFRDQLCRELMKARANHCPTTGLLVTIHEESVIADEDEGPIDEDEATRIPRLFSKINISFS